MAQNYESLDQSQTELLPTWVAAVPAILIGILAGLILHALVAMVVAQGNEASPSRREPVECQKNDPQRLASIPNPQSSIPNPQPRNIS